MKKKLLSLTGVAVMLALVTYASQANRTESNLSDVALENAEALAIDDPVINPDCPDGCLTTIGRCYCREWHDLEKAKWPND